MKLQPIDCIALERRGRVVEAGLRHLHTLYEGGKAAPLHYAKSLVILSFHFFDIHAVEEGMKVLRNVPADYFRKVLPLHMDDDPLYARLVERIAQEVVDCGLVMPGFKSPTGFFQNPGVGIA